MGGPARIHWVGRRDAHRPTLTGSTSRRPSGTMVGDPVRDARHELWCAGGVPGVAALDIPHCSISETNEGGLGLGADLSDEIGGGRR